MGASKDNKLVGAKDPKATVNKHGMRNVMMEDWEARTLLNGTYHGRTAAGWTGCKIMGYAVKSLQMGGIPMAPEKVFLTAGGGPPDAQVYCYLGCKIFVGVDSINYI